MIGVTKTEESREDKPDFMGEVILTPTQPVSKPDPARIKFSGSLHIPSKETLEKYIRFKKENVYGKS
jgi:hypothetical protein